MSTKRPNLGRGLDALLGGDEEGDEEDFAELDRARASREVPVEQLEPGEFQPRRHFDADDLETLANSVREKGVLQPILVRRHPEDANRFEIIAGERRWRAAQMAQLHEVPVIIRDFEDRDALEIALVENVQRRDLSPLEEAHGYRRLMEEFGHTQEDLAKGIGKSRSHIANTVRLLSLPDELHGYLEEGKLSAGHARALLGALDPVVLAEEVIRKGLNVRKTEQLVANEKGLPEKAEAVGKAVKDAAKISDSSRPPEDKDPDTIALEEEIARSLGMSVDINYSPGEEGTVSVKFQTLEQLDDLISRLTMNINSDAEDLDPEEEFFPYEDEDDPLIPKDD